SMSDPTEQFVALIAESQDRLFGYIYSLIGDRSRVADLLQETNLVLWRKREDYELSRPFLPWAFAIAKFQVLAHLRDQGRGPRFIDAELVEALAPEMEAEAEQLLEKRSALIHCLQDLDERRRVLIRDRYFQSKSINELSESLSESKSNIKVLLLRTRRALASCIEQRLSAGDLS
ncbi:MAG: sigma-70 family RNA polymerase sigma factor, partial [Planctomycetota bacterium]